MIKKLFFSMIYLRINRRKATRIVKTALWLLIIVTVLIYLIFPLSFRLLPSLQRHFIFQNEGGSDRNANFSATKEFDLDGAYNHFVPSDSGVQLGVWQILPHDLISLIPPYDQTRMQEWFLQQLGDERAVVLYCHGKKPSRATEHRVMLYKVLQNMNFHIITFDYRGYADSTSVYPTEIGVVQDSLTMVSWIRSHSTSPLYIWGHSLGTGIATKTSSVLCQSGICPDALFLQAPFTSIEDELKTIRATLPFRFLPWFNYMFISPLLSQGLVFDTKENIQYVTCPVLILHAEDDHVVPYSLGKKLFEIAQEKRKSDKSVQFASFDKKFKYGHNFICEAPELPSIIRDFLKDSSAKVT